MKITVIGGSGAIGCVLVPELVQSGHDVCAMQHQTPLPYDGVRVVPGSITDPAAVAAAVEGADVVMQLTKGGGGIEQVVETSVRGTVNVLDAIRNAGTIGQYLLTSSDAATGIGAHPYPEPISHRTSPVSYGDYYSLGKVLEETIVTDYDRNHGVPYTIARLSWTQREDMILRHLIAGYDRERPTRGPFGAAYSADQVQRLESGERFVALPYGADGRPLGRTLVQRHDVIAALVAMVGAEKAIGETFHVSGRGFHYDRPAEYLAGKVGLPVEQVAVPEEYSYDIDFSHTTERLGWAPKYDVLAMIDAGLAWKETQCGTT